jgi:hypothetical protein
MLAALAGCVSFQEPAPLPPRPAPTARPTPTLTLALSYCAAALRLLGALPLGPQDLERYGAMVGSGDEAVCRTVYNLLLGQGATPPTPTPTPTATPVGPVALWFNVGGERFKDPKGYVWEADPFGALPDSLVYLLDVGSNTNAVDGTVNDVLFISGRIGVLDAAFPVHNGLYEVTLYLMDPVNSGTGARVMDVYIEGVLAGDDVDAVRVTGGPYRAGRTGRAR